MRAGAVYPITAKPKPVRHRKHLPQYQCQAVDWFGKWMDATTHIRSIFRIMLKIEDVADGPLPPQGAAGGVSKPAHNIFQSQWPGVANAPGISAG